jgi:hypothetical protein
MTIPLIRYFLAKHIVYIDQTVKGTLLLGDKMQSESVTSLTAFGGTR